MSKLFINYFLIGVLISFTTQLSAQSNLEFDTKKSDESHYIKVPLIDSSYLNRDIFEILSADKYGEGSVIINQSAAIENQFRNLILNSSQRKINGFRIRVFFDNKQDSRVKSESVKDSFIELFPEIEAYRTYDNPYFKVTVGDFRTRSDAMKFFRRIERLYPSAFIVRESINFPSL